MSGKSANSKLNFKNKLLKKHGRDKVLGLIILTQKNCALTFIKYNIYFSKKSKKISQQHNKS